MSSASTHSPAVSSTVAAGRVRLDELDAQIVQLVRERLRVSQAVQQARVDGGGRRVELARETQIIARYREQLGRPGTGIAMALLELCRGRR